MDPEKNPWRRLQVVVYRSENVAVGEIRPLNDLELERCRFAMERGHVAARRNATTAVKL